MARITAGYGGGTFSQSQDQDSVATTKTNSAPTGALRAVQQDTQTSTVDYSYGGSSSTSYDYGGSSTSRQQDREAVNRKKDAIYGGESGGGSRADSGGGGSTASSSSSKSPSSKSPPSKSPPSTSPSSSQESGSGSSKSQSSGAESGGYQDPHPGRITPAEQDRIDAAMAQVNDRVRRAQQGVEMRSGPVSQQASQFEQQVLQQNPALNDPSQVRIAYDREAGQLRAKTTAPGRMRYRQRARQDVKQHVASRYGGVESGEVSVTAHGDNYRAAVSQEGRQDYRDWVSRMERRTVGRSGPGAVQPSEDAVQAVERQLERQVGASRASSLGITNPTLRREMVQNTDLQRGEDFTVERKSGGDLMARLTESQKREMAKKSLKRELGRKHGVSLEPGKDFKATKDKGGGYEAKLTEEGRYKVSSAREEFGDYTYFTFPEQVPGELGGKTYEQALEKGQRDLVQRTEKLAEGVSDVSVGIWAERQLLSGKSSDPTIPSADIPHTGMETPAVSIPIVKQGEGPLERTNEAIMTGSVAFAAGLPKMATKEIPEFAGYGTAQTAKGQGAEFAMQTGEETVERGAKLVEYGSKNPFEFTGTLIGSAAMSGGLIGAARKFGGPGAARAAAFTVQPGEELAISAARRGLVSTRLASKVPGVRRGHIGETEGEAAAQTGAASSSGGRLSGVRERVPNVRDIGPEVAVERNTNAGLIEIGPGVRQGVRDATVGRATAALGRGAEVARQTPRKARRAARSGREAIADTSTQDVVRAAKEPPRRAKAGAERLGRDAGRGVDRFMEAAETGAPGRGDVALQQAYTRGGELPRPSVPESVRARVAAAIAGSRGIESVMRRADLGVSRSGDVALQQAFTRGAEFPAPGRPELNLQRRASSAIERLGRAGREVAIRSPSVTGDVALQQTFIRGSEYPAPGAPDFDGLYRASQERVQAAAQRVDELSREVAARSPMVTGDVVQQQAFTRGAGLRWPARPEAPDLRGRTRREMTAARFGLSERMARINEWATGLSDATVRVGRPDTGSIIRGDQPGQLRSHFDNPLGIESDTRVETDTEDGAVARDAGEQGRESRGGGGQRAVAETRAIGRTGTGADSTQRINELPRAEPSQRGAGWIEEAAGLRFDPDQVVAPAVEQVEMAAERLMEDARVDLRPEQRFETRQDTRQDTRVDTRADQKQEYRQDRRQEARQEARIEAFIETRTEWDFPHRNDPKDPDDGWRRGSWWQQWLNPVATAETATERILGGGGSGGYNYPLGAVEEDLQDLR